MRRKFLIAAAFLACAALAPAMGAEAANATARRVWKPARASRRAMPARTTRLMARVWTVRAGQRAAGSCCAKERQRNERFDG